MSNSTESSSIGAAMPGAMSMDQRRLLLLSSTFKSVTFNGAPDGMLRNYSQDSLSGESSVASDDAPSKATPVTMDPRKLQALTTAFKGSVGPVGPRSTERKPSMLTLTRRTSAADAPSPHVKFVSTQQWDKPHSTGFGADNGRPVGILKSANKTPFATINDHKLDEDESHKTAAGDDHHAQQDADEEQRKALLATIQFHAHRDQSISRIDLQVQAERKWLHDHPQTYAWDGVQDRVRQYRSPEGLEILQQEKELAERFTDTQLLQGAAHVNNLLSGADNDKERLVVRLTFALLIDVVDQLAAEVGAEVLKQQAGQALAILNKSLVKAVASVSLGLEGSGSRYERPAFLPCFLQ